MDNNNLDAIKELLAKIEANLAELTKITKDREARFVERSNKPSTGGNRDFRSNRSFDDRRSNNWDDKKDFGNRRNNR